MELRTIYFQTLVSMVCIGHMCVVNGRQQAAEVVKVGVGRPHLGALDPPVSIYSMSTYLPTGLPLLLPLCSFIFTFIFYLLRWNKITKIKQEDLHLKIKRNMIYDILWVKASQKKRHKKSVTKKASQSLTLAYTYTCGSHILIGVSYWLSCWQMWYSSWFMIHTFSIQSA